MQHTLDASSSALEFPHTPFQFNTTLSSPLFNISPIASNGRLGWAPSCPTPGCLPTASWSTRLAGSTLNFSYWGWGIALDGRIEGSMAVQLTRNGWQERWNPSDGTLFTIKGSHHDHSHFHNITLKVLDASPDARLTVTQARVNGSSFGNGQLNYDRWTLASDDQALKYTGFIRRPSLAGSGSPTTYVSTTAGDKAYMQWNGSAVLLYGPCGPSNGLMRVTIDQHERILNTSKPFQSDDCLLFQSRGMPAHFYHRLEIENLDGGFLALDRMEFIRVSAFRSPGPISTVGEMAIIMLVVIVVAAGVVVVYTAMTRETAKKKFYDFLEPLP